MDAGADPLLGAAIGRYQVVRRLGKGGMGSVYEAVQPEIGSRVAIKVISFEGAGDAQLVERFLAEARAVARIHHENIIDVHDFLRTPDGRPAIVMELAEGQTLGDWIRSGPLPLGGVIQVMLDALSALAAAHVIGIVHRDLKPENIFVTARGRTKILDFGIAKQVRPHPGARAPVLTRTGFVLGTPEYMAPEQASGEDATPRSDLYALGVVMFAAITGRRPFYGDSDFEVMRAHVSEPPPSPRSLRPDVPVELEQVMLRALVKDPADRYPSAAAMAEALHAASSRLPQAAWRSLDDQPTRRPAVLPPISGPLATLVTRSERDLAATRHDRPGGAPEHDLASTRRGRRGRGPQRDVATAGSPASPTRRNAGRLAWVGLVAAGAGAIALVAVTHGPRPAAKVELDGNGIAHLDPPESPRAFDASGYMTTARTLAREAVGEVEVVAFNLQGVARTGRVDLTAGAGHQLYVFRARPRSSPSATHRCMVAIDVSTAGVQVSAIDNPTCPSMSVAPMPRCSLAQVWAHAVSIGAPLPSEAQLLYVPGPEGSHWMLMAEARGGRPAMSLAVPDGCGVEGGG